MVPGGLGARNVQPQGAEIANIDGTFLVVVIMPGFDSPP